MTITGPDARSAAPGQAVVDAAMLVMERMGLTPADLLATVAATPAARVAIAEVAGPLLDRMLLQNGQPTASFAVSALAPGHRQSAPCAYG